MTDFLVEGVKLVHEFYQKLCKGITHKYYKHLEECQYQINLLTRFAFTSNGIYKESNFTFIINFPESGAVDEFYF